MQYVWCLKTTQKSDEFTCFATNTVIYVYFYSFTLYAVKYKIIGLILFSKNSFEILHFDTNENI